MADAEDRQEQQDDERGAQHWRHCDRDYHDPPDEGLPPSPCMSKYVSHESMGIVVVDTLEIGPQARPDVRAGSQMSPESWTWFALKSVKLMMAVGLPRETVERIWHQVAA